MLQSIRHQLDNKCWSLVDNSQPKQAENTYQSQRSCFNKDIPFLLGKDRSNVNKGSECVNFTLEKLGHTQQPKNQDDNKTERKDLVRISKMMMMMIILSHAIVK